MEFIHFHLSRAGPAGSKVEPAGNRYADILAGSRRQVFENANRFSPAPIPVNAFRRRRFDLLSRKAQDMTYHRSAGGAPSVN